jgi:polar amino acid transport system substrate-binding protein
MAVGAAAQGTLVPSFWDPRRRLERPNLAGLGTVRFLTDVDLPPLNFLDRRANLTGFSVELARALCAELGLVCTIQARSFDVLMAGLIDKQGDAVIGGPVVTTQLRRQVDASDIYLARPARFAARRDVAQRAVNAANLATGRIGVEAATSHALYLATFFKDAEVRPYRSAAAAREALRNGEVDLLFADAQALATWFHTMEADPCCAFAGEPFLDAAFFGDGHAILLRRGDLRLRRAFDYGLQRLYEKGTYAELYLRWFPISLY